MAVAIARRNFFGKQGSFTSFFSRQGGPGGGAPPVDGAASIHGGAAGGFRQVPTSYPRPLHSSAWRFMVAQLG